MIHLVAFQDLEIGIGHTIYSDGTLAISEELVYPMISALNNFVGECTKDQRGLVKASLEDIKIFLYAPLGDMNSLRYVFFTDIHDNNQYLELKGFNIHQILSPHISFETFDPPDSIIKKVQDIAIYTQNFPSEHLSSDLLSDIETKIIDMQQGEDIVVADMFVGDLDQGKVFTFVSDDNLKDKVSDVMFAELLSSFSIDNEIWVTSTLNKSELSKFHRDIDPLKAFKEGWYLKQLASEKSDFWLVCYVLFQKEDEKNLLENLEWIVTKLSEEISPYLPDRPF